MVLKLQGGTEQSIQLNNLRKITFSGSNLVLNYVSGSTQTYGFSSLEKMYFNTLVTIQEVAQSNTDVFFNPSDNQIHFRNLGEGAHPVTIFRMDGKAVVSTNVQPGESVDMSGFPTSIYLVRIDNQVVKFKK